MMANDRDQENDQGRDRRINAYHSLPEATRKLVDKKTKEDTGFDNFLVMVDFFWKEKVYPFIERAYYGPQEGIVKLFDRLKNMFKRKGLSKTLGAEENLVDLLEVTQDIDPVTKSILLDLEVIAHNSTHDQKQQQKALRAFLDTGKEEVQLSHHQGRF